MDAAEVARRLADDVPVADLDWYDLVARLQELADAGKLTTDELQLHGLADAAQLVADELLAHAEESRRIVDRCLTIPPRASEGDIPIGF